MHAYTLMNPLSDSRVLKFPTVQVIDRHHLLSGSTQAEDGSWAWVAFDPATGRVAVQAGVPTEYRADTERVLAERCASERTM